MVYVAHPLRIPRMIDRRRAPPRSIPPCRADVPVSVLRRGVDRRSVAVPPVPRCIAAVLGKSQREARMAKPNGKECAGPTCRLAIRRPPRAEHRPSVMANGALIVVVAVVCCVRNARDVRDAGACAVDARQVDVVPAIRSAARREIPWRTIAPSLSGWAIPSTPRMGESFQRGTCR